MSTNVGSVAPTGTLHLSTGEWNVLRFVLTEITVSLVISECYCRFAAAVGRHWLSKGKPIHVTSSRCNRFFPIQGGIWPARSNNEPTSVGLSRIIPFILSCVIYCSILSSEFSSSSIVQHYIPDQKIAAYSLEPLEPKYSGKELNSLYNRALMMMTKCGNDSNGIIEIKPMTVKTSECLPEFEGVNQAFKFKDVCVASPKAMYAGGEDCTEEFREIGMANSYRTYQFKVKDFVNWGGNEISAPINPNFANGYGVVGDSRKWDLVYCRILKTRIANSRQGNTGAMEACLFSTRMATLIALPGVEFVNGKMTRGMLPDSPISGEPTLLKRGSKVWFAALVPSATVLFPFPLGSPRDASSLLRVVLQKFPRGESSKGGVIDQRAAVPQLMRPFLLTRLGIGAQFKDHNNTAKLVKVSRAHVELQFILPLYVLAGTIVLLAILARIYEFYFKPRFTCQNLTLPLDFESALSKMVSYDLNDGSCAMGSTQLVRLAIEKSKNPDYDFHLSARSKAASSTVTMGTVGARADHDEGDLRFGRPFRRSNRRSRSAH